MGGGEAEVLSGARRGLSWRGARGGGCPRPGWAVGAPFGRVFFSTSRRFFRLAPPAHCAAARNRMAAGLRRAGSRGGKGCVWARAAKTGRKCSAGRRGFADCYLAFEMGAALVEIPLAFSTCRKIWLCLVYMSPPRPAGALRLPIFNARGCPFLTPSLSRRRKFRSDAKAASRFDSRHRSCADTRRGIETLSIDHVPR